jgi:hypothetical protein
MKKNTLACSEDTHCNKRILERFDPLTCQMIFCMCQSFYYDKEPIMSNEEFDNLKEELTWEGSSVVMLSKYLCPHIALLSERYIMINFILWPETMDLRISKDWKLDTYF